MKKVRHSIVAILFLINSLCQSQSVVTLRNDGTILLNGNPFFPVGVYNLRGESGWVKDLNDCYAAGFNVLHIKNPSSKTILDSAYAKGIYIIIESDAFNGNPSSNTAIINTYKNHPALFGWIIGDDVHAHITTTVLQDRQNVLKANDPDHLTLSTGYNKNYGPYIGIADINGMYNYPIDNGSAILNDVDSYISWERGYNKTMMGIPQAFAWNSTPPNAAEYRNMVYQLIINNVKGYLPYVWYDGSNYLPNYTAMFNEAKAIHLELKGELIQAIMNGTYTRDNTGVTPDQVGVKAASWAYNGFTYVVIVNTANSSQTANVQLPTGTAGTSMPLFSRLPNTLTFSSGKLTGTIGQTEVEIYKIGSATSILANKNISIQNTCIYPNPANQFAVISYQLTENNNVKISVYDLLGKEIMQVTDEKKSKGEYRSNINTEQLPNGIYFVKMNVNGEQQTQKLIVCKSE